VWSRNLEVGGEVERKSAEYLGGGGALINWPDIIIF